MSRSKVIKGHLAEVRFEFHPEAVGSGGRVLEQGRDTVVLYFRDCRLLCEGVGACRQDNQE